MLANGDKFQQTGKIGAIEADFNNETGNIPFRADFPNPDGLLRHGQTGNVLIHRRLNDAIVIPQRATFEILDKRYVYVVGKDDVVHQREIVVQNELDDIFVIKNGLDVNDKIVLEGVRQVRDGEKVEYEFRTPEEVLAQPEVPRGIATASRRTRRNPRDHSRTMFTKSSIGRRWRSSSRSSSCSWGGWGSRPCRSPSSPPSRRRAWSVAIAYPGASANVLVDSVLIPLEQSINGVQDMRYMASDATSAGEATIRIYLRAGHGPEHGVVNVQNRVNIVMNQLPPLVEREGIIVSRSCRAC